MDRIVNPLRGIRVNTDTELYQNLQLPFAGAFLIHLNDLILDATLVRLVHLRANVRNSSRRPFKSTARQNYILDAQLLCSSQDSRFLIGVHAALLHEGSLTTTEFCQSASGRALAFSTDNEQIGRANV